VTRSTWLGVTRLHLRPAREDESGLRVGLTKRTVQIIYNQEWEGERNGLGRDGVGLEVRISPP
jgi:hypothetical protein